MSFSKSPIIFIDYVLFGSLSRNRTDIIRLVGISARFDQRPHYRLVVVSSGHDQRRRAVISRLVDVRARTTVSWFS